MKTVPLLCILALVLSPANAAETANPQKAPKSKPAASRPTNAQDFIEKSYDANKTNPAYFVASANYLWKLSHKQNVSSKPADPGEIVLADPRTGKPIGSIQMSDPVLQRKAVALLSEAYSRFPYRIDIGIALAFMQNEMGEPSKCCSTLIEIVKYSSKNEAKLLWKDGLPLPEPPGKFIPRLVQGYATAFLKKETKESYELCRKLCDRLIQVYPESPYAYSTLAGLSNKLGDKKSTIKYLLLAHQKAPKDAPVLFILASTYQASGDKANALKYFNQVVALAPNENIKSAALTAISQLRK